MAQVQWKNPETHRERVISILGVPANPDSIHLPGASRSIELLDEGRGIAFDEGSRPDFGAIAKRFREEGSVTTEVSGYRTSVAALFQLGASFAADGTLLASYETFFRLTPVRRSDQVDVGLITLNPGADPESVRSQLSALIGSDAEVLTRQGLVEREGNYWSDSLAVGYILGMNAILGLVVGLVIVYQILYTGVSDNLPEYATLKALGFPDRWLLSIVLFQGLLLSALGYTPALLIAMQVYSLTREVTSQPLEMTAYRAGFVYVVVLAMCMLSAAAAMRKIRTADPAEVF
jgi:putative ABC transport system permease protein